MADPHTPESLLSHTVPLWLSRISGIIRMLFPDAEVRLLGEASWEKTSRHTIYVVEVKHDEVAKHMARNVFGGEVDEDGFGRMAIKATDPGVNGPAAAAGVRNEAAALWLLECNAGKVPAPRLVAWSETGRKMTAWSKGDPDEWIPKTAAIPEPDQVVRPSGRRSQPPARAYVGHGWIV
jgi:hypothetical protein